MVARALCAAVAAASLTFAASAGADGTRVATGPADVRAASAVTGTGTINDSDVAGYNYRLVLALPSGSVPGDWVQFTTPTGVPKARPRIPAALFPTHRLQVGSDHRVPVRIGCTASTPAPCAGTIQLFAYDTVAPDTRPLTVHRRLSVPAGRYVTTRLRLSKAGREMLARRATTVSVSIRFAGISTGPLSLAFRS